MIKYTFKQEYSYTSQPCTVIIHTTDAESLDDLLDAFESFLRGSGFNIDGRLEIVDETSDM